MSLPRTIQEVCGASPASALTGTELIPVDQGGLTKGATTDQVKTFALTNPTFTGTATGNISGSSGSCTGNAATATNATNATSASSCTGNAATATTLQTARTINGVSFNGSANITLTFAPNFESSEQAITTSTNIGVAHGLGATPRLTSAILRCKTADAGFAVGDEIVASASIASTNVSALTVYANSTNIALTVPDVGFMAVNPSTHGLAGLTNANWKIVFRAWT